MSDKTSEQSEQNAKQNNQPTNQHNSNDKQPRTPGHKLWQDDPRVPRIAIYIIYLFFLFCSVVSYDLFVRNVSVDVVELMAYNTILGRLEWGGVES